MVVNGILFGVMTPYGDTHKTIQPLHFVITVQSDIEGDNAFS